MKCALVLLGESFRLGGQGSRNIGSHESFSGQMEASGSHLEFVRRMREGFGISTEIILNTYSTQFDEKLVEKYSSGTVVKTNFNAQRIGLQGIFNQSCGLVSERLEGLDFVHFMRVDLILKRPFMDIFYPETDRVLWPSVCFANWHNHAGSPRVSDMMIYVPRKHFGLIANRDIVLGHDGWHHLKHRIGNENQGLMLSTLHDSDSAKDWNPMYWISGRPRNETWASCNFKIDENLTVSRMNRGRWELYDRLS